MARRWWTKRPRTMRNWPLASPRQPVGVRARQPEAGAGASQGVRSRLDRGHVLRRLDHEVLADVLRHSGSSGRARRRGCRRQVEEDDEGGRDQQVGQHDVDVEGGDAGDVPLAEPLPPEDDLGDDGAAEHGGEVERDDGRDRDERVAQHVADEHPAPAQSLGPGQADVVGVEGLDHRRALIDGPRRVGDQDEREHRQRGVPGVVG